WDGRTNLARQVRSKSMHRVQGLTIGWLDTNIRQVVESGLLSQFGHVLITSIDSTTELASGAAKSWIAKLNAEYAFLGSGVVLPANSCTNLASDKNLFTGFDELWGFERAPTTPKPDDVWLVAPLNIETDPIPPGLIAWMKKNHCTLGLGDGIGL